MVSFARAIAPGIGDCIGILEGTVIKLVSKRATCHKHISQLELFVKGTMAIYTSRLAIRGLEQNAGYHIKNTFGKITIIKNYPRG